MPKEKLDPELKDGLKNIREECIKDCDSKRKYYIPIWKQAGYYWNDVQDIHWDHVNNDWATYNESQGETEFDAIRDANKNANVFRADGESLIAAATLGNFAVRYFPESANDAKDMVKAKSYSDITAYLQIKNRIKDLRREAFSIRYQFGLVGAYTYFERDEKYGTVKIKDITRERVQVVKLACAECEYEDEKRLDEPIDINMEEMEEYPAECPECGAEQGLNKEDSYTEERITGAKDVEEYRGCSKITLYNPLEMRVPFYAKKPEDITYVIIQKEFHYADARAMFNEMELTEDDDGESKEVEPNEVDIEAYDREQLDFYSSLSSQNLVTVTWMWLVPSQYNILKDDIKAVKALMKKYPKGVKATFIKDRLMKCEDEQLHKRWSFIRSPLDSHVYVRALGQASLPLQDITNDLLFIIMDTIKHGIGDTWIDARVINRKILEFMKQNPGNYIPVLMDPGSNKAIGDNFYSQKNATLSREVDQFFIRLEQLRQHVSGIFPSVFGGRFQGGSQTFGEYKQSRDQALQRISMPADNVDDFIADAFHKATELYAENMHGDEYYSVAEGNNFVNKQLKKPHSNGKISRVEVMKSEQFPLTFEQQKQSMVELLGLNINPDNPIAGAIFSPENINTSSKLISIPGFVLPGEAHRNKQMIEIQRLLDGQSPDNLTSSVPIDPEIDDDPIHIATIIAFAVSAEGMYQQKVNPPGWKNLMFHLQEHKQNEMKKMMEQAPPSPEGGNPDNINTEEPPE